MLGWVADSGAESLVSAKYGGGGDGKGRKAQGNYVSHCGLGMGWEQGKFHLPRLSARWR